jgi:hypothetical protein
MGSWDGESRLPKSDLFRILYPGLSGLPPFSARILLLALSNGNKKREATSTKLPFTDLHESS